MKRVALAVMVVLAVTFTAATAHAQATRTWVSGVGDDANPCSRTAPCKTFAGAISKTAIRGEISALDPGGFGAVTITKSITISGIGALASIAAPLSTNGITINILTNPSNDPDPIVVIRDVEINGFGSGGDGIRVLSAGTEVVVDNVVVQGFNNGIHTVPPATGTSGNVTVANSTITDNRGAGVLAEAGTISVLNSRLVSNNVAVQADLSATIRLSNNDVMNNNTGFACGTGGVLASASNNRTAGNVGGVVPVCNPNAVINVR